MSLCADCDPPHSNALAKYSPAFFRMSRSIRSRAFSFFGRANSSSCSRAPGFKATPCLSCRLRNPFANVFSEINTFALFPLRRNDPQPSWLRLTVLLSVNNVPVASSPENLLVGYELCRPIFPADLCQKLRQSARPASGCLHQPVPPHNAA